MGYDMRVNTDGDWNKSTVGSASGTFVDFGTATRVWLKADVKTHIRFGPSASIGSATTNDGYLTADVDYVLDVTPSGSGAKTKRASTNGTLYWKRAA